MHAHPAEVEQDAVVAQHFGAGAGVGRGERGLAHAAVAEHQQRAALGGMHGGAMHDQVSALRDHARQDLVEQHMPQ